MMPYHSYADRIGAIKSNADILLSTQTAALYLTQSSATVTYSQLTSSGSFLTTSSASATYFQLTSSTTLLTTSSATATYFPILSSTTLLTTSSATATYLTQSSASATYLLANSTIVVRGLDVSLSGILKTNGQQVGLSFSTYSPVGAFTFTATTNTLAVGTSSSTITLTSSGTYFLVGQCNIFYNAATFAASQTITLNIFRTNNTPGTINNSSVQVRTRIVTTITDDVGAYLTPLLIYTTTNTNDILSMRGSVSAIPSAGSLQANQANLIAIRLF